MLWTHGDEVNEALLAFLPRSPSTGRERHPRLETAGTPVLSAPAVVSRASVRSVVLGSQRAQPRDRRAATSSTIAATTIAAMPMTSLAAHPSVADRQPDSPHASASPRGDAPAARPRDAEADHRDGGEDRQTPHGCGIPPRFGDDAREPGRDVRDGREGDPAQVQAGHAVDQQSIERTPRAASASGPRGGSDPQRDQQQHDDDDGPLDREQLRGDQPEPVEHDRQCDPPPDRPLPRRSALARERLPDRVADQPEVDDRPDAERRAAGARYEPCAESCPPCEFSTSVPPRPPTPTSTATSVKPSAEITAIWRARSSGGGCRGIPSRDVREVSVTMPRYGWVPRPDGVDTPSTAEAGWHHGAMTRDWTPLAFVYLAAGRGRTDRDMVVQRADDRADGGLRRRPRRRAGRRCRRSPSTCCRRDRRERDHIVEAAATADAVRLALRSGLRADRVRLHLHAVPGDAPAPADPPDEGGSGPSTGG